MKNLTTEEQREHTTFCSARKQKLNTNKRGDVNDIRKKKTKGIYTTEHDDGLLQTKRKKCIHQRKHTTKRTINRRDNNMANLKYIAEGIQDIIYDDRTNSDEVDQSWDAHKDTW